MDIKKRINNVINNISNIQVQTTCIESLIDILNEEVFDDIARKESVYTLIYKINKYRDLSYISLDYMNIINSNLEKTKLLLEQSLKEINQKEKLEVYS